MPRPDPSAFVVAVANCVHVVDPGGWWSNWTWSGVPPGRRFSRKRIWPNAWICAAPVTGSAAAGNVMNGIAYACADGFATSLSV